MKKQKKADKPKQAKSGSKTARGMGAAQKGGKFTD